MDGRGSALMSRAIHHTNGGKTEKHTTTTKKRIEKKMSRYKCVKTSRQPGALWYRVSNLIALLFLVVKRWQQIPLSLLSFSSLSLIQFMLIVFMRQQGENWDRSPLSLPFFVLFSEEKPTEGGTWAVTEFFIINFVFSSGVGRGDEKVNRHKHPAALRETFFLGVCGAPSGAYGFRRKKKIKN
jgi:hypothetical protein